MDVSPVLPPPPRELDSRWQAVFKGHRRQRVGVGIALGLLMVASIWLLVARPTPQMKNLSEYERWVAGVTAILVTVGVMTWTLLMQRRRLHLLRHGEERLGTITGDHRVFLMRTLYLLVPHEDSAVSVSFEYPVGGPPFDEFDYKGQRLVRVIVDPWKPSRCHPIPKASASGD